MHAKRLNIVLLVVSAIAVVSALYLVVYPLYGQYFPKCLFYSFTGLYCPGCGSQRAIAALLHGDMPAAFHNNLLAIIAMPFLLYAFINYLAQTKKGDVKTTLIFYSPKFAKLVLIIVVLFGILRNIHYHPFTLLAPLN